jgi:hypothetical protein
MRSTSGARCIDVAMQPAAAHLGSEMTPHSGIRPELELAGDLDPTVSGRLLVL